MVLTGHYQFYKHGWYNFLAQSIILLYSVDVKNSYLPLSYHVVHMFLLLTQKILCVTATESSTRYCCQTFKHFFLEIYISGNVCLSCSTKWLQPYETMFFNSKILIPTPYYTKKQKFIQNDHSLSSVVTLCTNFLLLVVIDISLVCLYINDRFTQW